MGKIIINGKLSKLSPKINDKEVLKANINGKDLTFCPSVISMKRDGIIMDKELFEENNVEPIDTFVASEYDRVYYNDEMYGKDFKGTFSHRAEVFLDIKKYVDDFDEFVKMYPKVVVDIDCSNSVGSSSSTNDDHDKLGLRIWNTSQIGTQADLKAFDGTNFGHPYVYSSHPPTNYFSLNWCYADYPEEGYHQPSDINNVQQYGFFLNSGQFINFYYQENGQFWYHAIFEGAFVSHMWFKMNRKINDVKFYRYDQQLPQFYIEENKKSIEFKENRYNELKLKYKNL